MSDLPPISQKVEMDTSNYKAGISELNRDIRVIESGFKASAAALGDWGKSSEGLEMRIKSLGQTIDLQKNKVDGLKGVYEQLAAAGKTSAKEMEELQIKINKETETLNKMQSELDQSGKALDELGNNAGHAAEETDKLGNKMEALKSIAAGLGTALKVGAAALVAVGAAAVAAAGAMAGLVLKAADAAGKITDMSLQTGISATKLQEFAFIGNQIGVSTETIAGSMAKLTRAMVSARDGTGAQAEAFAKLGIAVTNTDGSLRDSQTVFQEALTALGGVANETERDALAMALFGKSALELNPLIKTSAAEMDAMREKAYKLGAVVSEEDISALDAFGDTLDGLKAGLQGTATTLAADLIPAFQGIANSAETYLGQLSSIVKNANGDMGKLASGLGGLLGKVATDIAAQAPKLLKAGLSIVKGILDAIMTALPTLIPAAVAIMTSLVEFLVQNLPLIIDAGVKLILSLVQGMLPMLPLLVDAALQMIITLANGLTQALPTLIPAIVEIIPKIILTLLENLPLLIDAALQLILALATGLVQAIPIMIPYIPQIVVAIFDALIAALPMIAEAAVQLIITLVNGLIAALPMVVTAAVQLLETYNNGIVSLFPQLIETATAMVTQVVNGIRSRLDQIRQAGREIIDTLSKAISGLGAALIEIGKNIVMGVWAGIVAMKDWFFDKVLHYFQELIDRVKEYLNIHSPSGVFADIGENMALGLGVGFGRSIGAVQRNIAGMVGDLANINGNIGIGANVIPTQQADTATSGLTDRITVNINAAAEDLLSLINLRTLAFYVAEEIQRENL